MSDTDYMGGPRHAPAPQISPMSQDQVGGTSAILNSAGRSRPRKSRMPGIGSPPPMSSPLRLSSVGEILGASKLGQRPPAQKTAGEEASDADEPGQQVAKLPSGTFGHQRRNPNGSVQTTPIGASTFNAYPDLEYQTMKPDLGELNDRLGISRSYFGQDG